MNDMKNYVSNCAFQNDKQVHRFNSKVVINIIIGLYFLLFIYAATSKIIDHEKFQLQISKSPIITNFAQILVWMVPAIEIIASVMLLIDRTILAGLYTSLAVMSLFTAYIIAILNSNEVVPCSCGGVLQAMGWHSHLIFNIAFMVMAIIALFLQTKITEKKQRKKSALKIF